MVKCKSNCNTCRHKPHGGDGWCYMFKEEPTDVCRCHSTRVAALTLEQLLKVFPKDMPDVSGQVKGK